MPGNKDNQLPVLNVSAKTLPEAWEKALIAVWEDGLSIRTEYDRRDEKGKCLHPPSKDATVTVLVQEPFAEPRIHQNFPGGPSELEVYRQEVVDGIHDHWIDPEKGKWTYTYHKRLFDYIVTDDLKGGGATPFGGVNQVEHMLEKLAESGHTRRAQAITWMPTADPATDDPPCLQRIWARLTGDSPLYLNLNAHWRSRDLYKAWFMNVYALTDLQRLLAEELAMRLGKEVRAGRYVDVSDSLHIYGSYFDEVGPQIKRMKESPPAQRAWNTDFDVFRQMTEETRRKLADDPDFMISK